MAAERVSVTWEGRLCWEGLLYGGVGCRAQQPLDGGA